MCMCVSLPPPSLSLYLSLCHSFPSPPSQQENLAQPQKLIMTDIDDPFLPHSMEDLLVNLKDAKEVREAEHTHTHTHKHARACCVVVMVVVVGCGWLWFFL